MAIVIGKTFNFDTVQSLIERQERVFLAGNSDAPLLHCDNNANPTVSQFSNYSIGQYGATFQLNYTSTPIEEDIPIIVATSSNIVLKKATLIQGDLNASSVSSETSEFQNSVIANVTVRSNLVAAGADRTAFFKIDAGEDFPMLVAYNDQTIYVPTGNRVGLGTSLPSTQLHVKTDALIEGVLNANVIGTTGIFGNTTTRTSGFSLFPNCNVIRGQTEVFGDFKVKGKFIFDDNIDLADIVVSQNLLAQGVQINNPVASERTALEISHEVESFIDEDGLLVSCNALPVVTVDVEVSATNEKYRVLTIDPFGRVGFGTTLPKHYLSLEATDLNKDLIGDGLIMARSTIDMCDDVFVVDSHARIGLGTTKPRHHLDIDLCDADLYDRSTIAVYHRSPCNIGSFASFTSNEDVIWEVRNDGINCIGRGAFNLSETIPNESSSSIKLVVTGGIMTDGNIVTSSMSSYGEKMNFNSSSLSNIGHLNAMNSFSTNMSACNLTAKTISFPGISVVEASQLVNPNFNNFVFSGQYALFSSNIGNALPADMVREGKVKIAIPNAFAESQVTNKVLVLEAPSPALTLRNTRSGNNQSTIQFVNSTNSFNGAISFDNNGFAVQTQATEVSGLTNTVTMNTALINFLEYGMTIQKKVAGINVGQGLLTVAEGLHVKGDILLDVGTINGGNLTVSGQLFAKNSVLQSSDSNLKTEILKISEPLEKIMMMSGYTYQRVNKTQSDVREMGLIAQEVSKIIPEVVRVGQDGHLAVAYGNLAGIFVEAIKTLTKKISDLTEEVDKLKQTINQSRS